MATSDALGDRMKGYEAITRAVLPRRTYTILRVDGKAFHSYTKGLERPYDERFMNDMDHVAMKLCQEVAGCQFAYVQSDEISLLLTDFQTEGTQPWFGGVVQKMASVSAARATYEMTLRRLDLGGTPLFDSRVFTIPQLHEVGNYFLWRQKDATRNSISMAARKYFSHKALHGVNTNQMQEMLWAEHQVNWNNYPASFKRGRVVVKETYQAGPAGEPRTLWVPWQYTPEFTLHKDGWLMSNIPVCD